MSRPTAERIEEIRQRNATAILPDDVPELLAEIDALQQERDKALRRAIEAGNAAYQDHATAITASEDAALALGREQALAARVRELEGLLGRVKVARDEGWYEDDPHWAEIDAGIAALASTQRSAP